MQHELIADAISIVEDGSMTHEITNQILLDHMQSLGQRMARQEHQTERVLEKIDKLQESVDYLKIKVEKNRLLLSSQIEALDDRMDDMEISSKEQGHEERIQKLEIHAGFRSR